MSQAHELVREDLDRVEELIYQHSEAADEMLSQVTSHLNRAGGKRLRPALLLICTHLGKGPSEAAYLTAAACEMTHLATLYHDDVIDEADSRRGVSTAHRLWGNHSAILAGDFLFARAAALASQVGGGVSTVLAEAVSRLVEGEYRELRSVGDVSRTPDEYFIAISGKTGALLEACARLGAMLGGCSATSIGAAQRFGTNFGIAFQLVDDLLDYVGTENDLGKSPGTDLREGVYTLPLLIGLEHQPMLGSYLKGSSVDFDVIRGLLARCGALQETGQLAANYAALAQSAVDELQPGEAREALGLAVASVLTQINELVFPDDIVLA